MLSSLDRFRLLAFWRFHFSPATCTGNGNSILLYFYLWTFLISLSLARPVIGTPQSAAMGLEPQESSSFRTVECGLWTRPRIFLLKNFNWRVKTRVSKINSPRNGIIKQVQVHSLNLRSRKLNADQPPRHRRAFNFGLEYIYIFLAYIMRCFLCGAKLIELRQNRLTALL